MKPPPRRLPPEFPALAETCDIIALKGDLGAGKTTFARAFIRAGGGTEEVPKPDLHPCAGLRADPRGDLAFRPRSPQIAGGGLGARHRGGLLPRGIEQYAERVQHRRQRRSSATAFFALASSMRSWPAAAAAMRAATAALFRARGQPVGDAVQPGDRVVGEQGLPRRPEPGGAAGRRRIRRGPSA